MTGVENQAQIRVKADPFHYQQNEARPTGLLALERGLNVTVSKFELFGLVSRYRIIYDIHGLVRKCVRNQLPTFS